MSQILVNGTMYSWGNVQVVMLGSVVTGITKLEYKRVLNHESVYGIGQEPIGYGYGNYTYTGSIEIYVDEWKKIYDSLGGLSPLSIPAIGNNISILFLQSQNGTVYPFKDVIYNVQFLEDGFTTNQGDTNVKMTIPFALSGFKRFS